MHPNNAANMCTNPENAYTKVSAENDDIACPPPPRGMSLAPPLETKNHGPPSSPPPPSEVRSMAWANNTGGGGYPRPLQNIRVICNQRTVV